MRKRFIGSADHVRAGATTLDRSGTPILGLTLKDACRTSAYALAMSNYIPKPLAVRVIYVKVDFGIGAWRRITPDIEIVKSPGTHEFPDMASVAGHLKARLQPTK